MPRREWLFEEELPGPAAHPPSPQPLLCLCALVCVGEGRGGRSRDVCPPPSPPPLTISSLCMCLSLSLSLSPPYAPFPIADNNCPSRALDSPCKQTGSGHNVLINGNNTQPHTECICGAGRRRPPWCHCAGMLQNT
jgi:hypothetical protein